MYRVLPQNLSLGIACDHVTLRSLVEDPGTLGQAQCLTQGRARGNQGETQLSNLLTGQTSLAVSPLFMGKEIEGQRRGGTPRGPAACDWRGWVGTQVGLTRAWVVSTLASQDSRSQKSPWFPQNHPARLTVLHHRLEGRPMQPGVRGIPTQDQHGRDIRPSVTHGRVAWGEGCHRPVVTEEGGGYFSESRCGAVTLVRRVGLTWSPQLYAHPASRNHHPSPFRKLRLRESHNRAATASLGLEPW